MVLGELNAALPFIWAGMPPFPEDWFDAIFDAGEYTLFPIPAEQVSLPAWAIGLHASALVKDGRHAADRHRGAIRCQWRALCACVHEKNDAWREPDKKAIGANTPLHVASGGDEPFEHGLYGCSEMLTLGLLDLYEGRHHQAPGGDGTRNVSRPCSTNPASLDEGEGIALHGGFFAGPVALYERPARHE